MNVRTFCLTSLWLILVGPLGAQDFYSAGTDTEQTIFLPSPTDQPAILATGASTHNLPGLSRNGRYVTFSLPDTIVATQFYERSDLICFDRKTNRTLRIIDHQPAPGQRLNVLSSQTSSNGQYIAYGVALGFTGSFGSINDLNIVNATTGEIIATPTASLSGTANALDAEFHGISFFPDDRALVTPCRRPIADPVVATNAELPAICRFEIDESDGEWRLTNVLSRTSTQVDGRFLTLTFHTFPALSADGLKLAYFAITFINGASTRWTAELIVANSNGLNANTIHEFDVGELPTGLTWSLDGSQIIGSVAPQQTPGRPTVLRSQGEIFTIPGTGGNITFLQGTLGNANAPMVILDPPLTSLSNFPLNLQLTNQGGITLSLPGLPSTQDFIIMDSNNSLSKFQPLLTVDGAQLAIGVNLIPNSAPKRFFRVVPD